MGEVWLVRHQILRDQFAFKLIVPGVVIDDETVKRFVLEAQVMRALSRHPHAVVVHDADIDMERTCHLHRHGRRPRPQHRQAAQDRASPCRWTGRLRSSVNFATCSIKPMSAGSSTATSHRRNLMLEDPSGRARCTCESWTSALPRCLIPSRACSNPLPLTEYGRFFGKRSYASPEQLNGERVDRRSDLYSIGVILYEFLTGYRPFHGQPRKLLHGPLHGRSAPVCEDQSGCQSPRRRAGGATLPGEGSRESTAIGPGTVRAVPRGRSERRSPCLHLSPAGERREAVGDLSG